MKRKSDIYLRVLAGACVTYENIKDGSGRLIIKVWTADGEDIIGFLFDKVETVDNVMNALRTVRDKIQKPEPIHPKMKEVPDSGQLH